MVAYPFPDVVREDNMTLEKVKIEITPIGGSFKASYVITCEHTAPYFLSSKLMSRIAEVLKEEFIAEGVENIRVLG